MLDSCLGLECFNWLLLSQIYRKGKKDSWLLAKPTTPNVCARICMCVCMYNITAENGLWCFVTTWRWCVGLTVESEELKGLSTALHCTALNITGLKVNRFFEDMEKKQWLPLWLNCQNVSHILRLSPLLHALPPNHPLSLHCLSCLKLSHCNKVEILCITHKYNLAAENVVGDSVGLACCVKIPGLIPGSAKCAPRLICAQLQYIQQRLKTMCQSLSNFLWSNRKKKRIATVLYKR